MEFMKNQVLYKCYEVNLYLEDNGTFEKELHKGTETKVFRLPEEATIKQAMKLFKRCCDCKKFDKYKVVELCRAFVISETATSRCAFGETLTFLKR